MEPENTQKLNHVFTKVYGKERELNNPFSLFMLEGHIEEKGSLLIIFLLCIYEKYLIPLPGGTLLMKHLAQGLPVI